MIQVFDQDERKLKFDQVAGIDYLNLYNTLPINVGRGRRQPTLTANAHLRDPN